MVVAWNTDCLAAMDIIEDGLKAMDAQNGTLKGKTMVVVGAGGVSKALAFGGSLRFFDELAIRICHSFH